MNIIHRFKSLPISTKRLLGLGIIFALFIALPLFVWAIVTQSFLFKQKAASGEPPTPTPFEYCSGPDGSLCTTTSCPTCPSGMYCPAVECQQIDGVCQNNVCVPGIIPTPIPSPTCLPRPACLDSVPRCLPAEPVAGWCPTPTPSPTPINFCKDPFILNINPQSQSGMPGDTLKYNISITNNHDASCGSYTTHLIVDKPSNWQAVFGTDTTVLVPGDTLNTYLDVTSAKNNYILGDNPLAFRVSTDERGYMGMDTIIYNLLAPTASPSATPTPTPVAMPGDVNGDGKVNIVDVGIIVDNYRKANFDPKADLNHDGVVNIVDLGIVIDNYQF